MHTQSLGAHTGSDILLVNLHSTNILPTTDYEPRMQVTSGSRTIFWEVGLPSEGAAGQSVVRRACRYFS